MAQICAAYHFFVPRAIRGLGRIHGRDAERAVLRQVTAEVGQGGRAFAVVEGEAGIGKSRLVGEAVAEAERVGIATVSCRCDPLAQLLPFAPLLDALGPVEASRTTAAADVAADRRFVVLEQLFEAVEQRAGASGLVLAVDDMQWSDEETLLTLRVLTRRLTGVPVGVVVALRPFPRSAALETFISALPDESTVRVRLGPLESSAIDLIIEDLVGASPAAELTAWGRRAEGNPFVLVELVSGFVEQGAVSLDAGVASVGDETLPASFVAVLRSRLAAIPAEVRELLRTASVLGTGFSGAHLAAVLGAPLTQVLPVVSEAIASGVLVGDGVGLRFRHDLFREAIYVDIPSALRPSLHLDVARALRNVGAHPIEIAPHLIAGAQRGDLTAVAMLQEASAEAALRAPGPAADLLCLAIDLLPEGAPQRSELLADVVRLLVLAGKPADAERRAREGLASATGRAEASLRAGLVDSLVFQGRAETVIAEAAVALARPELREETRAHILGAEANARLFVGDLRDAEAAGQRAVELGRRVGQPGAVCMGLVGLSCAARSRGCLDDSLALIDQAVADSNSPEVQTRQPQLWRARTLAAIDRLEDADIVIRAGQREAEELGLGWSMSEWHMVRSALLVDLGRFDEAAAEAEAGLGVAEQMSTWAMVHSGIAALAEISVRRGEPSTARSWIRRGWELVDAGFLFTAEFLTLATALVEDATGNPAGAVARLRPMYLGLADNARVIVQNPDAGARLVRLALRVGEPQLASLATSATQRLASDNPTVVSMQAAAAHCDGLLAGDAQRLVTAAATYRLSPRPLARASACEDAGAALQAAGSRPRAVQLVEEALGIYQEVGAAWDAARASKRLQSLGVRARRRLRPDRPATGWESLTQAERSVAELVAKGMPNPAVAAQLFISRHTVDSHLRHIFDKLDIRSRVELAAIVARLSD